MNKKTITKILVLMILIVLFTFNIKAEIFATIGNMGGELALSFADPAIANTVKTVQTAAGVANPQAYITSKISGEVMGQIMQELPTEAQQAVTQYNQVKGWVDKGAKISEDLKLTSNGQLAGGSIAIKEKQNVESLTDNKIGDIKNMELSTKGEKEPYQLKAGENGASVTIGKNTYENLGKDSTITVDRTTGEVKEMEATFTEKTTIKLGEDELTVPKGGKVIYKDKKYTIECKDTCKDQEVVINEQKIKINGENSIDYDGKKITGKDFTYDDKRFTGIGDKPAEMTPVKEGYLLGKNTKMEDDRMIITSEKGNTLYSTMCGDVSGYSNYVNPCSKRLEMNGKEFSVQLKEGKQFGLNIEKDAFLKYNFNGGEVILFGDGTQTVTPHEEGNSVVITNGGVETTCEIKNGEVQVKQHNVGRNIDVSVTTVYDGGRIVSTANRETNIEVFQVCPDANLYTGGTTAQDITTFAGAGSKCPKIVSLGGKNDVLTDKEILKKLKTWGNEPITKVYPVQEFEWPSGSGKISYGRIVETLENPKDPSTMQQTFITSDGRSYKLSIIGEPSEQYGDKISKEDLKKFGLLPTDNLAPTPEEMGIKWEQELPEAVTKKWTECNKLSQKIRYGGVSLIKKSEEAAGID